MSNKIKIFVISFELKNKFNEDTLRRYTEMLCYEVIKTNMTLFKYENNTVSFAIRSYIDITANDIKECIYNRTPFYSGQVNEKIFQEIDTNFKFPIIKENKGYFYLIELQLLLKITEHNYYDADEIEKEIIRWVESNGDEDEYSLTEHMFENENYNNFSLYIANLLQGYLVFSTYNWENESIYLILNFEKTKSLEQLKNYILNDSFENGIYEKGPGSDVVVPFRNFPDYEYATIDCRDEDSIFIKEI
jgi:hypothetical protein